MTLGTPSQLCSLIMRAVRMHIVHNHHQSLKSGLNPYVSTKMVLIAPVQGRPFLPLLTL